MSIDLLAPRFKVIADYPGSFWKVGAIITMAETHVFYKENIDTYSQYPHLFKKLEWWEGIDTHEIKYFRLRFDIPYYKLIKDTVIPRGSYPLIRWDSLLPATKEEFESYQSTIKI